MKEKKKLKIVELRVASFVTSTDKLKGGARTFPFCGPPYFTTAPKTCLESINWCWTP